MKIVSLNILHGGGKRIHQILDHLDKYHSDIIVLTEYCENQNAGYIRNRLWNDGYKWQASGTIKPKLNSVFVASRKNFISSVVNKLPEDHKHRVLRIQFNDFNMIAAYFPLNKEKRSVFGYVSKDRIEFLGNNGLFSVNFNTGRHYVDEKGKTFYCSEYFDRFKEASLIDSWRSRNQEVKEYSWYSSKRNGFRIDHAFSTPDLDKMVSDVHYSHSEREKGLSDHSALVVEYDL